MIPPKLKTGNGWLSLSDIKSWSDWNSISEQEAKAILFCKNWLNGNPEFEFHTSGSTGAAKKIVFTRGQLESSARLTQQALNLQPGHTALICLDVSFIAGTMMLVRSMVVGMNMIIKNPSANPLEAIADKIGFAAFVPYQFTTLLEQSFAQLNALQTIIIGGAPLARNIADKIQNMSPDIYATYGMTETITHVALQKLNGPGRQDFFELLPGIHASTDQRGCLVLTADHLGNDSIVTNDIVKLLDEKRFRWMGRYDLVINSGGVKVQAEKVESAVTNILGSLKIKKRFFVAGTTDKKLGEQVTLIFEGAALMPQEEESIKTELTSMLSKHEVPRVFLYVPRFSETATQKIDRVGTMRMLHRS